MNQPSLYPIAARPGVRYTVDRAGAPFLIHGDTAWSLITGVNAAGVARYLATARRRASTPSSST